MTRQRLLELVVDSGAAPAIQARASALIRGLTDAQLGPLEIYTSDDRTPAMWLSIASEDLELTIFEDTYQLDGYYHGTAVVTPDTTLGELLTGCRAEAEPRRCPARLPRWGAPWEDLILGNQCTLPEGHAGEHNLTLIRTKGKSDS